jgi:dolichol kinase
MDMSGNWRRWLWHLTSSLSLAGLAWATPRTAFLVALAVVTTLFISFECLRLRIPRLNEWFFLHFGGLLRPGERSRWTTSSYVLVAALVVYIAFGREIAVLAVCFLAVGDVAAAVVGGHVQRTRLFGRAVDGDLACFAACLAVGCALVGAGLSVGWLAVLAGSAAATVGQAIRTPVDDNLTLPLLSGIVMAAVPG